MPTVGLDLITLREGVSHSPSRASQAPLFCYFLLQIFHNGLLPERIFCIGTWTITVQSFLNGCGSFVVPLYRLKEWLNSGKWPFPQVLLSRDTFIINQVRKRAYLEVFNSIYVYCTFFSLPDLLLAK